jgi:hypothetical protein
MTDSSTENHNVISNRLDAPISQPEQETIINSLRSIDPVTYLYHSNPLLGKTKEGDLCYFPESYRQGYRDFLDGHKLLIELELFAIGQSTDGNWVFLPSYFQGVDAARNELKFALLVEAQKRLSSEILKTGQATIKQSDLLGNVLTESSQNKDAVTALQTRYESLSAENRNLKEMAEDQRKFVEEQKKQTDALKNQLQEVRTLIQSKMANTQQVKSSSTESRSSDKRGEKRKAAPIS